MVERTAAGVIMAVLALLVPVPALAADSKRRIWDAYPLPAQSQSSGQATGPAAAQPPAEEMATTPSDDMERLALASFLALVAGGLTTWLVSLRWPHARPARAGAAFARHEPASVRAPVPELWVHAVTPAPEVEEPEPELEPQRPLRALPAGSSPPPEPEPQPKPPLRAVPAGSSPPPVPPDADRAWAAEIAWHVIEGGAQFQVIAQPVEGGEPLTLGDSPPLEWPPGDARSVQALTDAVKTLELSLAAAGWTVLPPGSAWYEKRFAWQPGARPRPAPVARTRHRRLYEREFARQVERTERLRRTISDRLIEQGGQVAATAPE
jgi:hypothetical protein